MRLRTPAHDGLCTCALPDPASPGWRGRTWWVARAAVGHQGRGASSSRVSSTGAQPCSVSSYSAPGPSAANAVTAATSRNGKILYGIGVGVLAVVIREFSSYPEGFAFAVLLMNTCVPLIDYLITGPAGQSRSVAP